MKNRDNSQKIILDLCGGTGAWSEHYRKAGYTVIVLTLPEYNLLYARYVGNEIWFFNETTGEVLKIKMRDVYGILAAPVCTYFSRARSNAKTPRDLKKGMKLVRACMDIIWKVQEVQGMPTLQFWALENPMGVLRRFLGRPKFTFDPCEYGDPRTKKTDIWGWFNEPKKKPVEPKKGKRANPGEAIRSITPPGFAQAFFKANK